MALSQYDLDRRSVRDLQVMAGNFQSAITQSRNEEAVARRRADGYEADLAQIRQTIDVKTRVDPNGPLTDDQRRALFGGLRDAGLGEDGPSRYRFTRAVLGKDASAAVSWSVHKAGTITAGEASRLLDVLDAIK